MSGFALTPGDYQPVDEKIFDWVLRFSEKQHHVCRAEYPNGTEFWWETENHRTVLGRIIDGEHWIPSK